MDKKLSKLENITNLRSVWKKEAIDFTPWLADEDNIGILSEAIGIDISVNETESPVGDFNVDIFGTEVSTNRKIIIENQLDETNHDHLGKLITYASGKEANVIIWVVKKAREEHKAAIEWLNNHTDDEVGFFLCEIKLYKIDDSNPAVKFEVVEEPNDWSKRAKSNDGMTKAGKQHYDYWVAFQKYAFKNKEFKRIFNIRKPSADHWMDFGIGDSRCHLTVIQKTNKNVLDLDLNINDDKELYNQLYSKKDTIEKETGLEFDWREMTDYKASRIVVSRQAELDNKAKWSEQFDWIMSTLIKMRVAFKRYI